MGSVTPSFERYPPLASLQKDIYRPLPSFPSGLPELSESEYRELVSTALQSLSQALESGDVLSVKSCFFASQAYWRDVLAFTYHLRTISGGGIIAPAMLELSKKRKLVEGFQLMPDSVVKFSATATLEWIQGMFSFKTQEPAAQCGGTVIILPEEEDNGFVWKIWSMATWIDDFELYPQNEAVLRNPGRNLVDVEEIDTDVFIIGGGNASRSDSSSTSETLGVDCVIMDKTEQAGGNWAERYDCLKFHIQKSCCQTPYLPYPDEYPAILEKSMLVEHMKRYAETFNLNLLNSSTVEGSSFNESKGTWHFKIRTPWGPKTVVSRHLIQATGLVAGNLFLPKIPGQYNGISIHSTKYKNPQVLSETGVKSVIIAGSGNTAFDIAEDCAKAGLKTTMNVRSPTYIFPRDYCFDPKGLGFYDLVPPDFADKLFVSGPLAIGGQISRDQYVSLAAKEPNRYKALAEAGFPVYDSSQGGDLIHHLLEKGGGHYNEIGDGTQLIISGVIAVKAHVQPAEFTSTGLRFSDGSTLDADAIIWCTGFEDNDREITINTLGRNPFPQSQDRDETMLGPGEIALLRDELWGLDIEGELRGMWKRHLRVNNFWVTGGGTNHHRYYSWHLALQIKAALEGVLPAAYRGVPKEV
ncbi:uncharacterized protein N7483_005449 [Penicillium malachiteum]|uniref:uncharacterized protein n=1 Tax=Penicillium malachiteum TaxID=1324776 RepID=UPI002547F599|nr:uncharacterized protein N7483_005449 [Penicillium malachiteum]KAJ5730941.1 hypothetical protein N7483_005449 [Penicillium malachiteum]